MGRGATHAPSRAENQSKIVSGSDHIQVDYYDGAYGPTILIIANQQSSRLAIRDLLLAMSEGRHAQVDFTQIGGVRVLSPLSLILRFEENQRTGKSLILKSLNPSAAFEWSQTSADWKYCYDLVDVLARDSRPGHQYLTHEGVDDALVIISHGEHRATP
jgi:hypothetical protein